MPGRGAGVYGVPLPGEDGRRRLALFLQVLFPVLEPLVERCCGHLDAGAGYDFLGGSAGGGREDRDREVSKER